MRSAADCGAIEYPPTRFDEDGGYELHGELVKDGFLWMEDAAPSNRELHEWIRRQNELTHEFLAAGKLPGLAARKDDLGEQRGRLQQHFHDAFERTLKYTKFTAPFKRGDRFYWYAKAGLQNHFLLFSARKLPPSLDVFDANVADNELDVRVVLDPNTWSEDGTCALGSISFSHDSKLLAFTQQRRGSDWATIKVLDVQSNTMLEDEVDWVKFSSIAWTQSPSTCADDTQAEQAPLGFYYSRFPSLLQSENDADADANADANGDVNARRGTETAALELHSVYFHELGSPQKSDRLVFLDESAPTLLYGCSASRDGRFLYVSVSESCAPKNLLWLVDLRRSFGREREHATRLVNAFVAQFSVIDYDDQYLFIETNFDAPRGRVVKVPLQAAADWNEAGTSEDKLLPFVDKYAVEIVLQHEKDVLSEVRVIGEGRWMVTVYCRDVQHIVQLRDMRDAARVMFNVPLPDAGCVESLLARWEDYFFTYSFTNFTTPGVVHLVELPLQSEHDEQVDSNGSVDNYKVADSGGEKAEVESKSVALMPPPRELDRMRVPGVSSEHYETKQLFVRSKDGTRVPMFVVGKRGLNIGGESADDNDINKSITNIESACGGAAIRDASRPCLLYGYGGFMVSLMPAFSATWALWIEQFDGVVAVANLRGGGEYGEQWHDDGIHARKQNVFDDFHACAEALIERKVTRRELLTVMGGSNGGLLVGACINQRPDLYGCAVARVGVLDILRFHLFSIGAAWTSDFGDPRIAEHAKFIRKYSPLHNVFTPTAERQYPATLLTTADHDDRVVPLHSFKYIAQLQRHATNAALLGTPQRAPLLIRVDVNAGHGAGKPTSKVIDENADIFCFVARVLDLDVQVENVVKVTGVDK
mmetsp:Transcript_1420/g.3824  ORF Transcript_1420/g.3824 Transcript_1420/m.3824 type:complete len:874 (-) Transcript_1420:520-3141(-)